MLVLGEDGLALFERQAAGGTDALIFQQGYSCGASWLFSAWQGSCVESRLRSSAGEAGKWQAKSSGMFLRSRRCNEGKREDLIRLCLFTVSGSQCLAQCFAVVQIDAKK